MTGPVLSRDALDPARLVAAVHRPSHGATVLSAAVTPATGPGPRAVVALAYVADGDATDAVVAALGTEVAARFGAVVCVRHRIGEVPGGEVVRVVAASAPHRAEAFAACRVAVDVLARELPVRVQEIRADGTREWRDGAAPAIPSGA